MKNKDDIRTFIVVISVCVICVVLGVVLSLKSNVEQLEPVSEYNVFFSNVNYVNSYISHIANNNNVAVYDLLDEKYVIDNNITYDNVINNLDEYSTNSYLKVSSMDFVEIKDNFIYYIKGSILENNFDGNVVVDDNFSIVLMTDFDNLSVSLYPVDDRNYDKIINDIKKINIDSNIYNGVKEAELISKEQICVVYLSDFYNYLITDINKSYDILSDDMKSIYSTVDSFAKYINDNFRLLTTGADKCLVQNDDDKRVYSVIDINGNRYVFTEETIMNYKVDFYLNSDI